MARKARAGQVHQGVESFEPRTTPEIFWDNVFNVGGDYRRPFWIFVAVAVLFLLPKVALWWGFLALFVVIFVFWFLVGNEKKNRKLRRFNRKLAGTPEKNGLAANCGLINKGGDPLVCAAIAETDAASIYTLRLPAGVPPSAVEENVEVLASALDGFRGEVVKTGANTVDLTVVTRDTLEETVHADWLDNVQHSSAPPVMPDEDDLPFWEVNDESEDEEGGKENG